MLHLRGAGGLIINHGIRRFLVIAGASYTTDCLHRVRAILLVSWPPLLCLLFACTVTRQYKTGSACIVANFVSKILRSLLASCCVSVACLLFSLYDLLGLTPCSSVSLRLAWCTRHKSTLQHCGDPFVCGCEMKCLGVVGCRGHFSCVLLLVS